MRKITKLFSNDSIRSINEDARTAEYIISTDDVDRMGEIVEQSWDLENYKKNPIVLWGHDPSNPDNVLGKALSIETYEEKGRNITKAIVQFADEGTSKGVDTVWKLVKQGILKTVSVGFIPHTFKEGDEEKGADAILSDNELLEFSLVGIPANPQAVALAFGDGSISEKDAKWLVKQYAKESDYLEKSLYDTMKQKKNGTDTKEKAMSDEDLQKLAEAVGTAVGDALNPKLEAILEAVSGDEDAEADESTDGMDDTDADKGSETSNAKSEQTDEADDDGAFDENEELTPEQEKAFLKQLETDIEEEEREEDENS